MVSNGQKSGTDPVSFIARWSKSGASERAIAPAVGTSPATVHTDLVALRDAGQLAAELATVTSLDGRRRPSRSSAS